MFRIFIHAFNTRYGVNVRLVGNVTPNQSTGQLTAVVAKNPQQPFEEFIVHIDGGPHGALTSPYTCGPHQTNADFTPWGTPEVKNASAQSAVRTGHRSRRRALCENPRRPSVRPGLHSRDDEPQSRRLQPVRTPPHAAPTASRSSARSNVTLPPGDGGQAGRRRILPGGIDHRGRRRSPAKKSSPAPSCPASSLVGDVTIKAGSGADPFIDDMGKAYFAGPYKGAPVSLVFIVPAVAGPYDLGTDVVRTALNVEPETAVVHAVSDRSRSCSGASSSTSARSTST